MKRQKMKKKTTSCISSSNDIPVLTHYGFRIQKNQNSSIHLIFSFCCKVEKKKGKLITTQNNTCEAWRKLLYHTSGMLRCTIYLKLSESGNYRNVRNIN